MQVRSCAFLLYGKQVLLNLVVFDHFHFLRNVLKQLKIDKHLCKVDSKLTFMNCNLGDMKCVYVKWHLLSFSQCQQSICHFG